MFKKVLNFYINSSLHVALAVVAFSVITYLNFQIPIDSQLLLFIFLGTITGYNFIKYAGIPQFLQLSPYNNLFAIQILSMLALIGVIISLFHLSVKVIIVSAILGSFTLFYAYPISINHRNLRGIPGIKIYIIACVVAGVTVVLPLLDANNFLTLDHLIDFFQRCTIAVVLILPFEIRDVKRDTAQLGTIPQKLGILPTKILGYLLIGVFILIEFLKNNIHLAHTVSLIFLGIIGIIFLRKSSVEQNEYFASFWVEAAPWFWLGIFYLLRLLI